MQDLTTFIGSNSSAVWLGHGAPTADLQRIDPVADHAFCELAFVDDLALLVRAPSIDAMFVLAETALQAVHAAAEHRGLSLEMQAGKAEVGFGARKAKLHLADQKDLKQGMLDGKPHFLRVVHTYRHLGGWVHADAQPRHAVRDRITAAKQSWGPLVRPFFRKKAVTLATIPGFVVSRLTYKMHVLTKLSPRVLHECEASMRVMVAPLARPFLGGLAPFQFSTATVRHHRHPGANGPVAPQPPTLCQEACA